MIGRWLCRWNVHGWRPVRTWTRDVLERVCRRGCGAHRVRLDGKWVEV